MQECVTFTQVGGKTISVKSTPIPGTRLRAYSAWEPTRRSLGGYQHHEARPSSGDMVGRIGTTAFVSCIPFGAQREIARQAHYEADYRRAYAAICHAHPELAWRPDKRLRCGEIEVCDRLHHLTLDNWVMPLCL